MKWKKFERKNREHRTVRHTKTRIAHHNTNIRPTNESAQTANHSEPKINKTFKFSVHRLMRMLNHQGKNAKDYSKKKNRAAGLN